VTATVDAGTTATRTRPTSGGLLDQGDALGWMGDARDPLPQPGHIVDGQLGRGQQGEHIVERHGAHRRSSRVNSTMRMTAATRFSSHNYREHSQKQRPGMRGVVVTAVRRPISAST
jgi:hypothetical protein